jgi:UDP-glucuronate 4-epimerase
MQNVPTPHVLVTGAAGFIGFHVCERLLRDGHRVTGLDVVNDRFEQLRRDRLAALGIGLLEGSEVRQSSLHDQLDFYRIDIRDQAALEQVFNSGITHVIHLAALVGVRRSVEDPRPYQEVNIEGFFNVLDLSREYGIAHLVYASSSSVYGLTDQIPFQVEQQVDHPASFYAATKKANELFAHSYAHLHGLPVTGLRFFTVYGPWGRPDMAPYLFTRAIVDGDPIRVFNYGNMRRDFTYVGDISEGIAHIWPSPPERSDAQADLKPGQSPAPYRIYNIGHGSPVDIMAFIREIEAITGCQADIRLVEHQPGDVEETYADVSGLREDFGYAPVTGLTEGLQAYWDWFRGYY